MNVSETLQAAINAVLPDSNPTQGSDVEILMRGNRRGRDGAVTAIAFRDRRPIAVVKLSRIRENDVVRNEYANMARVREMLAPRNESPLPPKFVLLETGTESALVVAYVPGIPLSSLLSHTNPLSTRKALTIGLRVSVFLKDFHRFVTAAGPLINPSSETTAGLSIGAIHGDTLCRNFLMLENGNLCLLDWQDFSARQIQVIDLIIFLVDLASWTTRRNANLIHELCLPSGHLNGFASEVLAAYDPRLTESTCFRAAFDAYLGYAGAKISETSDSDMRSRYQEMASDFDKHRARISFARRW